MTTRPTTGPQPAAVEYPESDGRPMADSDEARKLMVEVIETLEEAFAARPDVYVSGNLLVYYEEGNPKKCPAPDVLVAFGVEKRDRGTYKVWEEGKAPDLVMELASKSTWRKDMFRKVILYNRLGVKEYFLFDRLGERFPNEPLIGLRLDEVDYQPIDPGASGRLESEVLGLELDHSEGCLRLWDPATGQKLMSPKEKRAEAEQRVQQEAELRQQAEQRVRQLEQELQRLRDQRPD
jgi:Uma2 family endonuclease